MAEPGGGLAGRVRALLGGRGGSPDRAAVAASGLVLRPWVAAQLGGRLGDDRAAVEAYLADTSGELSPHPLVEPEWVDPRRPWEAQGRTGLAWYLDDPEHRRRSPHPLVSLARIAELLPDAAEHPAGPVAAWLQHVGHADDAVLPSRPGTPRVTLGELVALAVDALASPDALLPSASASSPDAPAAAARRTSSTTVVLAVGADAARTVNWIRSVGDARDAGAEIDLVAVGGALRRSHRVLARTVAAAHAVAPPDLDDRPLDPTAALDRGLARARGERLVLVRPSVVPDAAAALSLARALGAPGVVLAQPLLVDRRDVVVSAGAVFVADGLSGVEPFLGGHAPADAERLGLHVVPSVLGPVVAATPEVLEAVGGLDPRLPGALSEVDLGLRARAHGRVVLDPTCRMTWTGGALPGSQSHRDAVAVLAAHSPAPPTSSDALLHAAGLDPVAYRRLRDDRYQPGRRLITESAPRLRWTLDTAARAAGAGLTWGDTHFAGSLAVALQRLGQHVAVDPAPARDRWSRSLDDVVLVVRGLDVVTPRPDTLNLLWVISHPDLVTAEEAAGHDHVFAASLSWSAERTETWGVPVTPLLQCTDPSLFHPRRAVPDTGADVLFVGNARGVVRPALSGALAAGARVQVHGTGWASVLPDLEVASSNIPNAELGATYAAARVVLNDHWDDMRRDGFLSNRLFDAAACATRIVSDEVAGIEQLFGPQVLRFAEPGEVGDLLARDPAGWPSYDDRLRLAAHVADQHSFDRRAATLLDTAVRAPRHP